MIEVIAADGECVAVAAKYKDMEVGARERNAAGKGQGPAMNEMRAVSLDEIRKPA